MEYEIYNSSGVIKLSVSASDNDAMVHELMNEHVVNLSFVIDEYVPLDINDYILFDGKRFDLLEKYTPEKVSTVEYEYNVQFSGIEGRLANIKVLKMVDNEDDLSFSYYATAYEHALLIVRNINRALGSNTVTLGSVIATEHQNIEYNDVFALQALSNINDTFNTEWYFLGSVLNIGRCELGAPIPLGYMSGLLAAPVRVKNDTATFFTRLFPLGSTRNIVQSEYGYTRLQLPDRSKYVEKNTQLGIIEYSEESAFAKIYPRRIGTISSVREQQHTDDEGKPFVVYYFKDTGLNFDPNTYNIAGLVKHVVFQSGELNGRDFEVNFDSIKKEFEIINQYPYGNQQIPGGTLVPKAGDEYILWNLKMPQEYITAAEKEFKQAVDEFIAALAVDTALYKATTDYIYILENNITLQVGQRITLVDDDLFPEGIHETRITKITRYLNNPYLIDIECSYSVDSGKVAQLENSIVGLEARVNEVDARSVKILQSGDPNAPTENNVLSALRSINSFHPKGGDAGLDFEAKEVTGRGVNGIMGKDGDNFVKLSIKAPLPGYPAVTGALLSTNKGDMRIAVNNAYFGYLAKNGTTGESTFSIFTARPNSTSSGAGVTLSSLGKISAKSISRNGYISLDYTDGGLGNGYDTRAYPSIRTDFGTIYFQALSRYSGGLSTASTGETRFFLNTVKTEGVPENPGRIYLKTDSLSIIRAGLSVGEADFISGLNGAGSRIDGNGNAEFNNLVVRGGITASEFIVNQIRASNGSNIISDCVFLKAAPYTYSGLNGFEWFNVIKGQELKYAYTVPFSVGDILNYRRVVSDSTGIQGVVSYYTKVTNVMRTATTHANPGVSVLYTGWLYPSLEDLLASSNPIKEFPFYGDNDTWVRVDGSTQNRKGWINLNASPYFGEAPQISAEVGLSGNGGGSVAQMGKLTLDGTNSYYGFMLKSPSASWRDSILLAYYRADNKAYFARIGNLTVRDTENIYMYADYYGSPATYGGINFQKSTYGASILVHAAKNKYVQLIYSTYNNDIWGIRCNNNGSLIFQLGSTNNIAGWNFNNSALYAGTLASVNNFATSGITLFSAGAISAKNFLIDTSGNVKLRGYIEATSGSIGGVNISNKYIGINVDDSGASGSFFADKYLGVRMNANYFRVDANSSSLQATIYKKTDTTAALNIRNESLSSDYMLGKAIESIGSVWMYGNKAIHYISCNNDVSSVSQPYPYIELNGVSNEIYINLRTTNGTRARGKLILSESPSFNKAVQVLFQLV